MALYIGSTKVCPTIEVGGGGLTVLYAWYDNKMDEGYAYTTSENPSVNDKVYYSSLSSTLILETSVTSFSEGAMKIAAKSKSEYIRSNENDLL